MPKAMCGKAPELRFGKFHIHVFEYEEFWRANGGLIGRNKLAATTSKDAKREAAQCFISTAKRRIKGLETAIADAEDFLRGP